jgi:hypothetical protein
MPTLILAQLFQVLSHIQPRQDYWTLEHSKSIVSHLARLQASQYSYSDNFPSYNPPLYRFRAFFRDSGYPQPTAAPRIASTIIPVVRTLKKLARWRSALSWEYKGREFQCRNCGNWRAYVQKSW